jgi:prenyltransferase beta subunit
MAADWRSILRADPTDWLLGRDNPSVRYFTLRDILDYSDESPETHETRRAIGDWEKVSRIFARQRSDGSWESSEQPYLPKYRSTYWQIMILSQLGFDKSDERINKACDFISRFQLEEGGFTTNERTDKEA